jgi:hypothetical protein
MNDIEKIIEDAINDGDFSPLEELKKKLDIKPEIRNLAAQKLIDKILFYQKIGRKDIAKRRAEALLRLINS